MILTNDEGIQLYIDDSRARYSPYLDALLNVEEYGSSMITSPLIDDTLELPYSSRVLENFVRFLEGLSIYMDEENEEFFSFMGFPNTNEYPLIYWGIKLRDNWIRDNMYKYELWREDPYFGLVEVPIIGDERRDRVDKALSMKMFRDFSRLSSRPMNSKLNLLPSLGKKLYLAGGAALYLAGAIDMINDYDLFFVGNRDEAMNIISPYLDDKWLHISSGASENSISIRSQYGFVIQFILRLYKSPTEIVHGFDLDSVGILYDGDKLWATERTLYSIRERFNWFDPTRASPSYTSRLLKYHLRGFRVMLPSFDLGQVNEDLVTADVDKLMKIYLAMGRDYKFVPELVNSTYSQRIADSLRVVDGEGNRQVLIQGITSTLDNRNLGSIIDMSLDDKPDLDELKYTYKIKSYIASYKYGLDTDGIGYYTIDRTRNVIEGFKLIMNIIGLSEEGDVLVPDDFPFIRDQIALWYDPDTFNEGKMVGVISRIVSKLRGTFSRRSLRREEQVHGSVINRYSFSTDSASLLILAFVYDIVYINDKLTHHDYAKDEEDPYINSKVFRSYLSNRDSIKFVTQDPMSQVTSTFSPDPIPDILEFYNESDYYNKIYRPSRSFPMQVIQS